MWWNVMIWGWTEFSDRHKLITKSADHQLGKTDKIKIYGVSWLAEVNLTETTCVIQVVVQWGLEGQRERERESVCELPQSFSDFRPLQTWIRVPGQIQWIVHSLLLLIKFLSFRHISLFSVWEIQVPCVQFNYLFKRVLIVWRRVTFCK